MATRTKLSFLDAKVINFVSQVPPHLATTPKMREVFDCDLRHLQRRIQRLCEYNILKPVGFSTRRKYKIQRPSYIDDALRKINSCESRHKKDVNKDKPLLKKIRDFVNKW